MNYYCEFGGKQAKQIGVGVIDQLRLCAAVLLMSRYVPSTN